MYRNFWPRITLLCAVLFLVIGLVKPVYAILLDIDTNDGAIDADWANASPNPYLTDSIDVSAPGNSTDDIVTIWVATGPSPTADYLYFRTEVEGVNPPALTLANHRQGIVLDCDGDQAPVRNIPSGVEAGDFDDLIVYYRTFEDQVQVIRGDYSGGFINVGTSADGENTLVDNYEWRVLKSDLVTNGCATATGNLRFAGIVGINAGVHDTTGFGPLWNTPTAVSLQTLTASTTGTWLTVVSLALAALLFATTIILRRRNQTAS